MTINAENKKAVVLIQLPETLKVVTNISSRIAKLWKPIVKLMTRKISFVTTAKIELYQNRIVQQVLKNQALPVVVTASEQTVILVPGQEAVIVDNREALSLKTEVIVEVVKDWDEIISDYKGNIQTVDLRPLETIQAMSAMSGELRYLHGRTALLFILKNRLPIPFLDKLAEEKFDYHIKVIAEGEMNILIFKGEWI